MTEPVVCHASFVSVRETATPLSRAVGVPIDGVLGNDVLLRSPFKLNYSKQIMSLGPLSQLGDLGTPVQMKKVHDQFFVPITLVSLRRELLVDTGTNSTNLSWSTWEQLSKMWKPKSVVRELSALRVQQHC